MTQRCKESSFVGKESRFFTTQFFAVINATPRLNQGDVIFAKRVNPKNQLWAPIITAIFNPIFA
jgi:hypothetical protein